MAKATKEKANTINIKSEPVQAHIGSQKWSNDDWSTIAFLIDRREIQHRFADPELRYNCIYFLIGYGTDKELVYVGQAKKRNDGESVLARLREHDKSTTEKYCDQWQWIVAVTNKNDAWSLDDLNALEHAFYAEIPADQNLNGNNPNSGGADYDKYVDKIQQIKSLVTAIGFEVFADIPDKENIQVTSVINDNSTVEDLQNGMARIPEIVTPDKVVKAMVDMLPADVWNSHTTFLDPACKGGEYLREIYDRLMETEVIQSEFPNQIERSNHILKNQIYGIALSQVSLERTAKKLMGFDMNIRVIPDYINKLKGINLGSRPDGSQNNILDILNKEFGKEMKFDVVIGNPPYQEESGGRNAIPLYNRFMSMGLNIADISLWITPSRWFSGGIGLDSFRHEILSSNRIALIKNYKQAQKIFNGVDIAGGVSITSICKHSDTIRFIDGETGKTIDVDSNFIKEREMLLDRCEAYSIVNKTKTSKNLDSIVLPLNAFGLQANFEGSIIPDEYNNIEVLGSYNNVTYINETDLEKGNDIVDKYKVIVGKASSEHAGVPSSDGRYNVFSNNIKVLKPNQVCTFSYIVVGTSSSQYVSEALCKYIKTKLSRFSVLVTLASMNISARNFMFVPLQDFTANSDIDWSQPISNIDQQLYKKYNLTQEEIDYIEKTIKPME